MVQLPRGLASDDRLLLMKGRLPGAPQGKAVWFTVGGGAEIILLDEPTAGMSRAEAEHAVALIRKLSEGRTLLIIEHDMGVVFNLADRISVLVYGKIIASDEPAKIKSSRAVQEAYLGAAA